MKHSMKGSSRAYRWNWRAAYAQAYALCRRTPRAYGRRTASYNARSSPWHRPGNPSGPARCFWISPAPPAFSALPLIQPPVSVGSYYTGRDGTV